MISRRVSAVMLAIALVVLIPGVAGAAEPNPAGGASQPRVHFMNLLGAARTALGLPAAPSSGAAGPNGIDYNGGPVVMGEKVVAIYWSNSVIYTGGPTPGTTGAGAGDGSLVGQFLRSLGGSPYYNINSTYTDGNGTPIPNSLAYTAYWANNHNVQPNCVTVSNSTIANEIIWGFNNGKITYDPSTVYAVMSPDRVNLGGGFGNCTWFRSFQYCAYHGSFNWNGRVVLYAAMPYANAYPGSCTAFQGGPPNGDPGADAEVNLLAHELEESNTDPQLNAWYDSSGAENADKCAWTFGTTYAVGAARANMVLGGRNFLIQQNWLNANGGLCALSYQAGPTTAGPATLSAVAAKGAVNLSWTPPASDGGSSITDYRVYRGASSGAETLLGLAGSTSAYTDSAVVAGGTYYYRVAAVTTAGEGAQSNEVGATPFNVPGAPALTATAGPGRINLSWTAAAANGAAVSGYNVYAGTTAGTESPTPVATLGNVFAWSDSPLSAGVPRFYVVKAVNAAGTGGPSNEATATPTTPPTPPGAPALNASGGLGGTSLTWSAPASNGGATITGYNVYRGATAGAEGATPVATLGNVLSWNDSPRAAGTYWYVVRAVNSAGPGAASNESSALVIVNPPGAPALSATGGVGKVVLSWTAPSTNGGAAVSGYNVYRGTITGGEGTSPVATLGNVLTWTDSPLGAGTYWYVVRAVNTAGPGTASNEASGAVVSVVPPSAPGLSVFGGPGAASLSWSAPANTGGGAITGYNVYRGTSSGGEGAVPVATLGAVQSWQDSPLAPGTYWYVVRAVNSAGPGAASTEGSAVVTPPASPPGAPTLSASTGYAFVGTGIQITALLSWSVPPDNGAPITNYRIYRGTSSTNATLFATVSGGTTTFVDNTSDSLATRYYSVSAVNSAGEGPGSNQVGATQGS